MDRFFSKEESLRVLLNLYSEKDSAVVPAMWNVGATMLFYKKARLEICSNRLEDNCYVQTGWCSKMAPRPIPSVIDSVKADAIAAAADWCE